MVYPALKHALPSLWAEACNWACYIIKGPPHSALHRITLYEAFYNAKPSISHLRPFNTKCYAHIDEDKRSSGSNLEPRSIEGRLIGYTDSGKMFRIDFSLKYKVDTVREVKFEASSYTSVDGHTPPLPSDFADNPATIMQELRSATSPPTIETTTPSTQQTLPGSYTETRVQCRHPPLFEGSSPATNIQDCLEVTYDELESE